jgi:hypothetical protein
LSGEDSVADGPVETHKNRFAERSSGAEPAKLLTAEQDDKGD